MSSEAEILIRLSDVFAQRDIPIQPVLKAIQAGGTNRAYVVVSAFTDRMALFLPSTPDVLTALRPDLKVSDVPPEGATWRIEIDRDQFKIGVTITDRRGPTETVEDLVPAPARTAWLSTIERLLGFASGAMMNFTRWYTQPGASMAIKYPERSGQLEDEFVRGLDDVTAQLGVSAAQRELWKTLYPLAAANVALSVSTYCGPTGPERSLGILYGASTWDRTISVTNAIAGRTSVEAREVATRLGMLAGALELEQPRGLEIILDASNRPEVMVWLAPR